MCCRRFYRLICATAMLACALLVGCQEDKEPIRIGIHPWPAYEFFYLAQERGLFKKYGIEVEVVEFDSSVDSMRAFAHGNLDAFCGTSVELISSQINSQVAAKAAYVIDFSNGADQIIAVPEIKSLNDLKGKRVAFESGTLDYVTWSYALKKAGLSFSDVSVESVPQGEIVAAFRQNRIDAAATYPPVSINLLQAKLGHSIFDSSEIPGLIVDLLIIREDLIAARKNDLVKLVKALSDAQEFATKNPDEAYLVMAKREQVNPNAFSAALQGIHLVSLSEQYGLLKDGGKIYEALSAAANTLAEKGMRIDEAQMARLYTTDIAREVVGP